MRIVIVVIGTCLTAPSTNVPLQRTATLLAAANYMLLLQLLLRKCYYYMLLPLCEMHCYSRRGLFVFLLLPLQSFQLPQFNDDAKAAVHQFAGRSVE